MLVAALVLVPVASGHYGNRWFATKSSTQDAIMDKYRISRAVCAVPPSASDRSRFDMHSLRGNEFSAVKWDHFICAIRSEVSGRGCLVLAHHTGQEWWQIVLTSQDFRGCGPQDIRKRPG